MGIRPSRQKNLFPSFATPAYTRRMTTVNAHFDGRAIVLEEPLDLSPGEKLRVHIQRDIATAAKSLRRRTTRNRDTSPSADVIDDPLAYFALPL